MRHQGIWPLRINSNHSSQYSNDSRQYKSLMIACTKTDFTQLCRYPYRSIFHVIHSIHAMQYIMCTCIHVCMYVHTCRKSRKELSCFLISSTCLAVTRFAQYSVYGDKLDICGIYKYQVYPNALSQYFTFHCSIYVWTVSYIYPFQYSFSNRLNDSTI